MRYRTSRNEEEAITEKRGKKSRGVGLSRVSLLVDQLSKPHASPVFDRSTRIDLSEKQLPHIIIDVIDGPCR